MARPLIKIEEIVSAKPIAVAIDQAITDINNRHASDKKKIKASEKLAQLKAQLQADPALMLKVFITCASSQQKVANVIKFILEAGFDINTVFDLQPMPGDHIPLALTGLHLAVLFGSIHIPLLLQNGANPLALSLEGKTPLHYVNNDGQLALAQAFLTNLSPSALAAVLAAKDSEHDATVLIQSVARGHLALTEAYLAAGAEVNQADNQGNSPLHLAASYGTAIISIPRSDPRAAGVSAETTAIPAELFSADQLQRMARQANYQRIIDLLLAKGANPTTSSINGNQPIHQAAVAGNLYGLEKLLNAANMNIPGAIGTVIDNLIYAWKSKKLHEVTAELWLRRLMQMGAYAISPELSMYFNTAGFTSPLEILYELATLQDSDHAFVLAARKGDLAYITANACSDPMLLSQALFNAIAFPSPHQHAICEALLSQGADPNAALAGNSALHLIAIIDNKKLDLAKLMVSAGANVQLPRHNLHGETAAFLFESHWAEIVAHAASLHTASHPTTATAEEEAASKAPNLFNALYEYALQSLSLIPEALLNSDYVAAEKQLTEAEKHLASLERVAENSELWAKYHRVLGQYQQLCEKVTAAKNRAPLAAAAEEAGEMLSVKQIRLRLAQLLARHASADTAAQPLLAQQIQYHLIHVLETYGKRSRAAYHLRQLLVHEGHTLQADASRLLELTELLALNPSTTDPLANITDKQLENAIKATAAYQQSVYEPFVKAHKRPLFTDKRSPEAAIASFIAACQTLSNAQAILSDSAAEGSPIYQDQAELARLAIYQLREFLRAQLGHKDWQHPIRDVLLTRLNNLIGEPLTKLFRHAVCSFASEAIHNLHSIQLDNIAWESITTRHLREVMRLCSELMAAGLSEASLLSPAGISLHAVASIGGASAAVAEASVTIAP